MQRLRAPRLLKRSKCFQTAISLVIWHHAKSVETPRCIIQPGICALGLVALPNILIFQVLLPFLSPLVDAIMLVAIISGNGLQMLGYYLLFLLIDAIGAIVAFSFEKEKLRRLWLLLPQRFSYRQMMYWVLFKSIIAAARGQLVGWGVLKRTGKVGEVPT